MSLDVTYKGNGKIRGDHLGKDCDIDTCWDGFSETLNIISENFFYGGAKNTIGRCLVSEHSISVLGASGSQRRA